MITHCLVALVLAAGEPASAGAVTWCEGSAVLVRESQSYRLVHGASIEPGDEITCGEHGRIAIYLTEGQSVMLAPGTRIRYADVASVIVDQGEARITCDGWPQIEVQAGAELLHLGRGIIRVRASAGRSHWQLEHGKARLESADGPHWLTASAAQQTVSDDQIADDAAGAWTINPAVYQRSAVEQVAPPIEPPADLLESLPEGEGNEALSNGAEGEEEEERLPRPETVEPAEPTLPEAPEVDRGAAAEDARRDLDAGATVSSATFGSFTSFSLGSFSGASPSFSSGGLFADANQATLEGSLTVPFDGLDVGDPFPGNIHLVTAENEYQFNGVQLTAAEQAALFAGGDRYFSIGLGAPPQSQVITDVATGTDPTPTAIEIPQFDGYLLRLDQYAITDPAEDPAAAAASNFGITGLLGPDPTSPTIVGATPLLDDRAAFNEQATFALGEFRVTPGTGNSISFGIRRSDQDRLIIKDPGFNDANDQVTPNPQVSEFVDVADPRFQPAAPTVKVPAVDAFDPEPNRFGNLNDLRRAAVTTLVADQLFDYSRRTGQTRFVVDGKIIDISGYRR